LAKYRRILRIDCQSVLEIGARSSTVARINFVFAGGEQRFASQRGQLRQRGACFELVFGRRICNRLELLGGGIHIAAVLQRASQFHTQLNIVRLFGAGFLQIVDGGRPVMQARFHITKLHARDVAFRRDLQDLLKIL
jgi:hypothetical protein